MMIRLDTLAFDVAAYRRLPPDDRAPVAHYRWLLLSAYWARLLSELDDRRN